MGTPMGVDGKGDVMFWIGFAVGLCVGLVVSGVCYSSSRADLETELLETQAKLRRTLRGELPNR